MKRERLRRWYWAHKWSSLVCTLFLLLVCITGLPLVFRDEIGDWNQRATAIASSAPVLSLDAIAETALRRYPGDRIASLFCDDDEPKVFVAMVTPGAAGAERKHALVLESHTATVLEDSLHPLPMQQTKHPWVTGFMGVMLQLHVYLFAGLPGQLFLALMALLFVAAIVTGVVLYAPFMKKLDFGTVRRGHSSRLKWLDLHNLLGIVLLGWTLVVGVTGLFNELSTPLTGLWQLTTVPKLLAPYKDKPMPAPAEMVSPQTAMDAAHRALPEMTMRYIAWPGKVFGTSPQHYVVYARGSTPATFELIEPVLVDARTGKVDDVVALPWYLKALELSRPLHFGDYGGLPLKILWALLDLATIVVLGSGLYLWLARRKHRAAQLETLAQVHAAEHAEASR